MVQSEYPDVVEEFRTVKTLLKGRSIARFGDGELKILNGKGYIRESENELLTRELRSVLTNTHKNCLIGIPTMDPGGPKAENWLRHRDRFCQWFKKSDRRKYYSAFITRPDSAPAIESAEYVALLSRLWLGKRVAIISEQSSKLLTFVRTTNEGVKHIRCNRHGAFAQMDKFIRSVDRADPDVVLLSVGPTATILANRFSHMGLQALDLGSIGGFLCRWLDR